MEERKARLRALAAKAGRLKPEEASTPSDIDLSAPPSETIPEEPTTKKAKTEPSVLEKALEKAKEISAADASDNGATKKMDWDLKKDIQPKLDKLEKRYQRALVKLLKQRLENEASREEGS